MMFSCDSKFNLRSNSANKSFDGETELVVLLFFILEGNTKLMASIDIMIINSQTLINSLLRYVYNSRSTQIDSLEQLFQKNSICVESIIKCGVCVVISRILKKDGIAKHKNPYGKR